MSRCDVIIVNFNAGSFLRQAVDGVLRSPSVAQVFVVDNASTDASLDLLSPIRDDRVLIVRNSQNLGFAKGCNIGLARGSSENFLLLNPDCRVEDGAIETLIAALAAAGVGMVGPLLLNADGSEQTVGRRKFPTPGNAFAQMLHSARAEPLPEQPADVDAISGACMMVRSEAVASVGVLDEHYFLHCEDLDWCTRFRQHGLAIRFVPAAKVTHEKGVSSRRRPVTVEYHKHKGMIYFYQKFLSSTYPRWMSILIVAGVWARFAGLAILRLFSRAR